jgi:hypothetical protein
MRVRIARDELRRLRQLTQAINALESEIAELVGHVAPQVLTEPGFEPLTAAKLVGEIAGADRFATDAKLARSAGLAPIPVSSGRTDRHRLDSSGNRHRVPSARSSNTWVMRTAGSTRSTRALHQLDVGVVAQAEGVEPLSLGPGHVAGRGRALRVSVCVVQDEGLPVRVTRPFDRV